MWKHPRKDTTEWLYKHDGFVVKEHNKRGPKFGDQQLESQAMCFRHIKSFRNAIDIGARYGGWTRPISKLFNFTYAFEPQAKWNRLFAVNIKQDKVKLFCCGLGDQDCYCQMQGSMIVGTSDTETENSFPVRRLDDFFLSDIDFIKIDVDGFEKNVLIGGRETIVREKPIICMEVIGGKYKGQESLEYILSMDYEVIDQCNNDYLFKFNK